MKNIQTVVINTKEINNVDLLQKEVGFIEELMKVHGVRIDNLIKEDKEEGKTIWKNRLNNFIFLEKIVEPELLRITYNKIYK